MKIQKEITHSPFLPFEDLARGVTAGTLEPFKTFVIDTLKAPNLIFEQKRDALAAAAMRSLPYPSISEQASQLIRDDVICLTSEGAAPFHPRYVAPDYQKLLKDGCEFLELRPAADLHEATANLLTAYYYIPCGGLPVFIGRLDELLEPYVDTVSPETARAVLRSFWLMVDRLNPSAFVHANIGPRETRVGRSLLEIERELETITNLTLRYDPDLTPTSFALLAIENALALTKPYFLNHRMMVEDWGEEYVIASCYNTMLVGGGIYTLVRLNFNELAKQCDGTVDDLLDRVIPKVARLYVEVINSRIKFLVEEIEWFENSFWIHEGLLRRDRFTAYAGVFGLAEAVNTLMAKRGRPDAHYGHDAEANTVAERITERLGKELSSLPTVYCDGRDGRVSYHAQVGISSDTDTTPGARVPSDQEPDLYAHLLAEAPHHRTIEGGISTILEFDQTAAGNPAAVLDIIKGAHQQGIRMLSVGSANSEFVRVTGYLIRRADLEAASQEKALRHSSASLGVGFFDTKPVHLHRRTRKV
jgi:YjjI family glycine radical enzyme